MEQQDTVEQTQPSFFSLLASLAIDKRQGL
jgi:hypothetical protein